jgi:hypothetical protein
MKAESERLAAEQADLDKLARKQKIKLDLSLGMTLAAELAKKENQLVTYLDGLAKHLQIANSEETRQLLAMVKRAELLEKQADFDKAIEQYESALKARDLPEVKAHLDHLKAAWAIKSPEHGQARQFIYSTWPTLDLPAVHANLNKAKESSHICRDAADRLTPRKLLMANLQHANELAKELEVLRKAKDSQDNRTKLKEMLQLVDGLRSLQLEVETWIAKDKNAGK